MADNDSTVGAAAADPRNSLNRSVTEVRADQVLAHETGALSALRSGSPAESYTQAVIAERRVAPVNQRG